MSVKLAQSGPPRAPNRCLLMIHNGHAKREMLRHATPLLFKANGLPVTMCATSRLLCRWGCRRPLRDLLLPLGFVPPVDQSPGAFCIGKFDPSLGHCGKRVSYRYVGGFLRKPCTLKRKFQAFPRSYYGPTHKRSHYRPSHKMRSTNSHT